MKTMLQTPSRCILRPMRAILLATFFCFSFTPQFLLAELDARIEAAFNALNKSTLETVDDSSFGDGFELPSEILSPERKPKLDPYAQEEGDKLNQEELELVNSLMPLMQAGDADQLPELLIPFSNSLPLPERDISIAKVVLILNEEMGTVDGSFWGTSVKAWIPLVESRNPIYRYLALKGIRYAVPEPLQKYSKQYPNTDPRLDYLSASEKFNAYIMYFDETDNSVRLELYKALRSVPLQANLDYLKSQLSIYESSNERDLIDALEDAIKNVERLLGSPPEGLPPGWELLDTNSKISPDPSVEEITKAIEGVASFEPVIEEPTELVVVEPIEEVVEKPSNWWFWLVGGLLLFGFLGFALRNKSQES